MWTEKEGTALSNDEDCRMAMVLVAMLSGGDYAPEGLTQFGMTFFQYDDNC
jgi:Holliday junction resolvase YEN1